MRELWKRHAFGVCYAFVLTAAALTLLLDAFVVPRGERAVRDNETQGGAYAETGGDGGEAAQNAADQQTSANFAEGTVEGAQTGASGYQGDGVSVTVETLRAGNTTYYVADIQISDASLLRTALAQNTYGRNIRQTTSAMARGANAILAVNGDYYGFRNSGYVLRNGTLYRETANANDLLLIDRDGDFTVLSSALMDAGELDDGEWWQVFSFGPALVENGVVTVAPGDEVGQAKVSNPRTAIGQLGRLHYAFVVSDGRTDESEGFTLLELAEIMRNLGCETAYNLDGGGSSTMVFMGEVVNQPTTNGRRVSEREVSDIVYIGS